MAVIAVFNQKGGVGKTTTCLNVTAALDIAERYPTAIDLDPQGHLTLACGVEKVPADQCVSAFFKHKIPLANLLKPSSRGWQVIPSSLDLATVDSAFGNDPKAALILRQGLQEDLALTGEPILIDCCPTLGALTLNALLACDRVLIPVSADFLSLQGAHRFDSALSILESKLKRKLDRKIVITRFDGRRKLSFEIADKLRERYGSLVCNTRIAETVALATSPMHGKDVFAYAPNSPGSNDYRSLAKELWDEGFFA